MSWMRVFSEKLSPEQTKCLRECAEVIAKNEHLYTEMLWAAQDAFRFYEPGDDDEVIIDIFKMMAAEARKHSQDQAVR